ncbi:MFS transporter [Picrophilus oshimae]|uniref:Hypothetical sugar transporter n=1 Tax=Picrophilus torridus (strain ATCC 700027 / DSM 9790 / JCM 10055 / NBRC 100828 / KAW 2/3) TaxID=1122961 RepID=Q6L1V8_PICTO|nr:MFS transporter [Picrophilus oshimae]AAT43044.1 hypothetical sugar transporter [Picrophilus oshimae DSM 9789]
MSGLSRNVTGIMVPFLLSAYTVFSIAMIITDISRAFSVSITDVLVTVPVDFVGGAIGGLAMGYVADRIGRKPVILIAAIMFSVGTILGSLAGNIIEIYIIWFIIGFGVNADNGMAYPLIVETLRRSSGSIGGITQSLYFLGFLLDSVTYIIIHFWRYYLLAIGIISLIFSVGTAILINENKMKTVRKGLTRDMVPKTISLSLVTIGAFMFTVPLLSVVPTLLNEINVSDSFVTLYSIVGFSGFVIAGILSDRFGRKYTTLMFTVPGLISSLILYFITSSFYIIIIMIPVYIFSGFFSFLGVWVGENYPFEIRASATNIVFFAGRILGGFSPFIVSLIGPLRMGLSLICIISALLAIIGAATLRIKKSDSSIIYSR